MPTDPIEQAVVVAAPAATTFDRFVDSLADWWPLRSYSLGGEAVVDVVVPHAVGGRVHEVRADGSTATWGEVTEWDPPRAFAMTWAVTSVTTDVRVTFRAVTETLTRVVLTHSGWERLTEEQLAEATNAAGGYTEGWRRILAGFQAYVEAPPPGAASERDRPVGP